MKKILRVDIEGRIWDFILSIPDYCSSCTLLELLFISFNIGVICVFTDTSFSFDVGGVQGLESESISSKSLLNFTLGKTALFIDPP